jgi:Transcription termination factor nusG
MTKALNPDEIHRLADFPPFRAELAGEPGWYVLLCAPQHEAIAAAHLAARGFGVYLPEVPRKRPGKPTRAFKRSPPTHPREPMFTGYLFAFVFGFDHHCRRILSCPGITGVLAPIDGEQIDAIRAVENQHLPTLANLDAVTGKTRKRRWRRSRVEAVPASEIVAVRTWSAFTDKIVELDSNGRNGLLRRALGL